jgi:hypothetical protein
MDCLRCLVRRSIAAALLAAPLPAVAQTCDVPGDFATVGAALADSSCAEIDIAPGTFEVALVVARQVVINGAGQGQTILTRPAGGLAPLVLVGPTGDLLLQDLTVDGDPSSVSTGRHGIANANVARINRVEVVRFEVGVIDYPSSVRGTRTQLFSCQIHDNQRGVQTETSMLLIQACQVSANGPGGGVVMIEGNILDSTIANNLQQGDGGGVFIEKSGSIRDSEVIGNVALGGVDDNADGGGVFILGDSGVVGLQTTTEVVIDDSLIEGNYANGFGGGVAVHRYTTPPPPAMPGGKGPSTPPVGSQHVYLGNLVMTGTTVRDNVSNHIGGGISIRGEAVIEDSVIDGNQAVRDPSFFTQGFGDGGGIGLHRGEAVVERTAIVRNSATENGGGIVNGIGSGGTLTLRNSTVAENRADGDGGGLFTRDYSLVQNTTIAGNIADHDGDDDGDGGGIGNPGQTRLHSTIIFDNADRSPGTVMANCVGREPISLGYNLFPDSVDCVLAVPNPPLGPDILMDPVRNAGQTGRLHGDRDTFVVAISPKTKAPDAGSCLEISPTGDLRDAVDQRGLPRAKQDGNRDGGADGNPCDIGAYEIQHK